MPLAMSVTVPMRPIGNRAKALPARLCDVVGAEIARPHDQDLVAHIRLGRAGMDRVDANSIALPRELEC